MGAREVSRSLGTASKREAVAASLPLRLFAFQIVKRARAGGFVMGNDEMLRMLRRAKDSADAAIAREEQDAQQAEADARGLVERVHLQQLAEKEAEAQRVHLQQLAEKEAEAQRLREVGKAGIRRAVQLGEEKVAAGQRAHTAQLVQVVAAATTSASKGSADAAAAGAAAVVEASKTLSGPLLSVLVADYLRSKKTTKSGNEKTQLKLKTALNLLVSGVGDRPCNRVMADDIVDFLERLQRLPANSNKLPGLIGLTFEQLTDPAAPRGKPIADNTVNGHMTRVSGMFKWALSREKYLLRANPATGSVIKKPVATKRRPFTPAQMVALFSHESFSTRRFMHPHYFWLMPIAALSGMRLNEVCQLGLEDFKVADGVDIVSCVDLEESRRGKNDNARRLVPIHDELKRLGLLRWVEGLRTRGEDQLFPELKAGRDGHGQAPSKWFQGYRAACGIDGKQVYVFHSFRHYFINRCLVAGELPHNIAAIAGHETGLITVDIYGQDFDMKVLQAAVNKVKLPPEVLALVPMVEECTFTKKPTKRPPSQLGARKSRAKRVADAAARKAGKGL